MNVRYKFCTCFVALLFGLLAMVLAQGVQAAALSEDQYTRNWCQKEGGRFLRLTGAPTPVCELGEYRVAAVLAENWAAAIGGAYFAIIDSVKKPGAALIWHEAGDQRYWNLLNRTINKQHLPFRTWIIQP